MNINSRIKIILVRPESSGNIGSVCRAMKTMGFNNLAIVNPNTLDINTIKTFSVHAYDVFETAKIYDKVEDAVADSSLVIGTTRRRGKNRKTYSVSIEDFALNFKNQVASNISILFGNEKHGLSAEELTLCSKAIHIPSSPLCPSLNLSHSVQIICYELFIHAQDILKPSFTPLNQKELHSFSNRIAELLLKAGIRNKGTQTDPEPFIQDILARAGASLSEAERLEALFTGAVFSKKKEVL